MRAWVSDIQQGRMCLSCGLCMCSKHMWEVIPYVFTMCYVSGCKWLLTCLPCYVDMMTGKGGPVRKFMLRCIRW